MKTTKRTGVNNFMLREFKTSTILELDEGQIFRLMKYMDACTKEKVVRKRKFPARRG